MDRVWWLLPAACWRAVATGLVFRLHRAIAWGSSINRSPTLANFLASISGCRVSVLTTFSSSYYSTSRIPSTPHLSRVYRLPAGYVAPRMMQRNWEVSCLAMRQILRAGPHTTNGTNFFRQTRRTRHPWRRCSPIRRKRLWCTWRKRPLHSLLCSPHDGSL